VALSSVALLLIGEDLLAQADGVLPGGVVGNDPVVPVGDLHPALLQSISLGEHLRVSSVR
jgi:hypothetical protein